MQTLTFSGTTHPASAPVDNPVEGAVFSPRQVATVVPLRDSALQGSVDLAEDDLVELQFDDGSELITSGGALMKDADLVQDEQLVGGARNGVRGLRIFGAQVAENVGEVIDRLEARRPQGLFFCKDLDAITEPAEGLDPTRKTLVLIHGTGNHAAGSFNGLQNAMAKLWADYDEQVVCFQHPSLGTSPVDNAIALLKALPANAELHVVTQSRGGLVGELLCLTQADFDDLPAGGNDYKLPALKALLAAKTPRVTRYCRVACPGAGTLLASKRLDWSLSLLLNAMCLVPALRANPAYLAFKQAVRVIVASRKNTAIFPGLEAMMPESPFIRWLNSRAVRDRPGFGVVGADSRNGRGFSRLRNLLARAWFRQANDCVVHTRSMTRGLPATKVPRLIDDSDDAYHFGYFSNRKTRKAVLDWLDDQPVLKAPATRPGIHRNAVELAVAPDRATVIVVPGVMGSVLKKGNQKLWPSVPALLAGGFDQLRVRPDDGIQATGLVERYYDDLIDALAKTWQVETWPYDWRKSVLDLSRDLASALDQALARPQPEPQPIHVVAHSMGGALMRLVALNHPEVWNRFRQRRGRVLLLGCPLRGAVLPVKSWSGKGLLGRALSLTSDDAAGVVQSWPSSPEFVPAHVLDALKLEDAERARVQAVQALMADESHVDGFLRVLGQSSTLLGTPRVKQKGQELVYDRVWDGDGTVLWESSALPTAVWYSTAGHSDLPDETEHKALKQLLRDGQTRELSATPPPTPWIWRGEAAPYAGRLWDDDQLAWLPDDEGLVRLAFGGDEEAPRGTTVEVELLHADLGAAGAVRDQDVVLVGYSRRMGRTARVVDTLLDGQVRADSAKGRLLGTVGWHQHYPNADGPDVVMVGLGDDTRFGRAAVRDTVATALVQLAPVMAGRTLHTVLLGAGSHRGLSPRDALAALLEGVHRANRTLLEQQREPVRQLVIIEKFRDIATHAAHAAHALATDAPFATDSGASTRWLGMRTGAGNTAERPDLGGVSGPVRRLDVRRTDHALWFREQGELAGNLEVKHTVDWDSVDDSLKRLRAGEVQALSALTRKLLPPRMREVLAGGNRVSLQLPPALAHLPWERLDPRQDPTREPLGARVGLTRQMVTDTLAAIQRPESPRALFIGAPQDSLPRLPHATEEVDTLGRLLDGSFTTQVLKEPTAADVTQALDDDRGWQIVHIAAHGMDRGGGEGAIDLGNGRQLSAATMKGLARVPDLVFLNACHAGRVPTDASRLAAALAGELLHQGVRVVVVAGWEVLDRAAMVFAQGLYTALLDGERLVDAVRRGRKAAWAAHPASDTWAAFQVYGDCGFQLTPAGTPTPVARPEDLVSAYELRAALAHLRAESARPDAPVDLLKTVVQDHLRAARREWLRDVEVLFTFGEILSLLGEHDHALSLYDSGMKQLQDDAAQRAQQALEVMARLDEKGEEGLTRANRVVLEILAMVHDKERRKDLFIRWSSLLKHRNADVYTSWVDNYAADYEVKDLAAFAAKLESVPRSSRRRFNSVEQRTPDPIAAF